MNQKFTIPYINSISQKLKHVINDLDIKTSYYNINKLGTIIKGQRQRPEIITNKFSI